MSTDLKRLVDDDLSLFITFRNTIQFCPKVLIEKRVYDRVGDIVDKMCVEYNRVHRDESRRHEIGGEKGDDKHQCDDEEGQRRSNVV